MFTTLSKCLTTVTIMLCLYYTFTRFLLIILNKVQLTYIYLYMCVFDHYTILMSRKQNRNHSLDFDKKSLFGTGKLRLSQLSDARNLHLVLIDYFCAHVSQQFANHTAYFLYIWETSTFNRLIRYLSRFCSKSDLCFLKPCLSGP